MKPYGVNLKLLNIEFVALFVVFALALFLAAGTVFWPAGWAFLVLFFGADAALGRWLLRHDPGLLQERMTGFGKPGEPTWDKVFFVVLQVFFLAWLVLMPLDAVRFRWSQMPGWLQVVGAILLLGSFYLFFLTFRENPYSVTRRPRPNRARANGDLHRAVSLCAPSDVCRGHHLHGRHHPHAGVLVWVTHGADLRRRDSISSRAGGTRAASRTARI